MGSEPIPQFPAHALGSPWTFQLQHQKRQETVASRRIIAGVVVETVDSKPIIQELQVVIDGAQATTEIHIFAAILARFFLCLFFIYLPRSPFSKWIDYARL